jgi:hypothetical protein
MTEKEFFNTISNGSEDVLQLFLEAVSSASYCVIGGLAVNAYAEPVVSLDLDIVVAAEDIERVCKAAEGHFKVERFTHRVNLSSDKSSLRIQIQTDPRYLDFIGRAAVQIVLGDTRCGSQASQMSCKARSGRIWTKVAAGAKGRRTSRTSQGW